MMTCGDCGRAVRVAYYCDRRVGDGPWCEACFEALPCRATHDEDCPTTVVEGEETDDG